MLRRCITGIKVPGQGFAQPKIQHENNFAEMIPVISGVIVRQTTEIVSAKLLNSALGVRRDFTNWIKGRIAEYGFSAGVDFEVVETLSSPNPASTKSRQQVMHKYLITLRNGYVNHAELQHAGRMQACKQTPA
jgi:hypothetical protein